MAFGAVSDGPPSGELESESLMFFTCASVFGAQAIAVGLVLNRVNDRFGYWLNLVALGVVDAAFVALMVAPGHVDPVGGLSGPLVWAVAAVASTVARRADRRGSRRLF
ncbi:hypothetical protein GCM10029992_27170 [Glycomyces albus]